MALEERLHSGILLAVVEEVAGYARERSVWPASFGPACSVIELVQGTGPGSGDTSPVAGTRADSSGEMADDALPASTRLSAGEP
jgi:hypothetical protein